MSSLNSKSSDLPDVAARPSRGEVAVVVLIVACGFMLRVAYPTTMAVEHFDEGVYASNLWFGEAEEYRYPFRHLYAPPLFPFLLKWTQFLFGPTHWGTMLVGIFCGGCTVAVVWWVAREWFGLESGIAAATLAAFSDFHILYSRTALTDVPLSLWMLLAVYFIWKAFHTLRLRWVLPPALRRGWDGVPNTTVGFRWRLVSQDSSPGFSCTNIFCPKDLHFENSSLSGSGLP